MKTAADGISVIRKTEINFKTFFFLFLLVCVFVCFDLKTTVTKNYQESFISFWYCTTFKSCQSDTIDARTNDAQD